MEWPQVLSAGFLVLAFVVLWMAYHGMFSKKVKSAVATLAPTAAPIDPNADLLAQIKHLQGVIFELQNDVAAKDAKIKDLTAKLAQAMQDINQISADLLASQAREAEYNKVLKQALEDLKKCRLALSQCRADDLARQLRDAACKLQPENADLLR